MVARNFYPLNTGIRWSSYVINSPKGFNGFVSSGLGYNHYIISKRRR